MVPCGRIDIDEVIAARCESDPEYKEFVDNARKLIFGTVYVRYLTAKLHTIEGLLLHTDIPSEMLKYEGQIDILKAMMRESTIFTQ